MIGQRWRVALALGLTGVAPALGCGGERHPTEAPAPPGIAPRTPPGMSAPVMPPAGAPAAGTFQVVIEGTTTASLSGDVWHDAAPAESGDAIFGIKLVASDTTYISILRAGPEQLRPGIYLVGRGWGGDTVSVGLTPPLSDPRSINNFYLADSGTVVVTYRDAISVIGTLRAVASKYYPPDRSTGQITITGSFHSVCPPEFQARGICGK